MDIELKLFDELEAKMKADKIETTTTIEPCLHKNTCIDDEHLIICEDCGLERPYFPILHKQRGLSYNRRDRFQTFIQSKFPNLEFEDKLLDDFCLLVNAYILKFRYELKIERKNFLNNHCLLFELLHKHGYDVDVNKFKFPKGDKIRKFHMDTLRVIFKDKNWKFREI